jgi:CheY-like chemotaxis protein
MLKQQETASISEAGEGKMILIVEDDADTGLMLVCALEECTPHSPLLVESSTAALRTVQEKTPDLFLLDYYLPAMTALELSDRLHSIKGLQAVPTIVMTAGTLPLGDEQEIFARQIVLLRKPFDLDELLETIETLLREKQMA